MLFVYAFLKLSVLGKQSHSDHTVLRRYILAMATIRLVDLEIALAMNPIAILL